MIRAVIDTSVLVSAVIRPQGALGFAIKYLREEIYSPSGSIPGKTINLSNNWQPE
jgi:predicted nucleic acid-binding protein